MGKFEKILSRVLSGQADVNIAFDDLCRMLERSNFSVTIRGSHHNYRHPKVYPAINLQSQGKQAKEYQVKQVHERLLESGILKDDNDA